MPWFAHSTKDGPQSRWESLADHLAAVAATASRFAAKFDAEALGRALGLLHDLGKYDPVFLKRLAGDPVSHDHSTAGACIAAARWAGMGKLLAYAIAGHHAGLADGVREERGEAGARRSLEERLRAGAAQAEAALARAGADGLVLPALTEPAFRPSSNELKGFQLAFFGRMLFSCLVDADFLETERFYVEVGESTVERPSFPRLAELKNAFDAYMAEKVAPKADVSAVNRLRADVLAHARCKAAETLGVFTLTVPTGGGKTLTSLAFALDHAVHHGLDRIVYVIPFTSIIEQTADVFRTALKPHAEAVLEHHSAFDETRITKREGRDKLRLTMENWTAPVVVTGAVAEVVGIGVA